MEICRSEGFLKADISTEIENLVSDDCSESVSDGLKSNSKSLYDHLYKDNSLTELRSKSFRKLLIDGFDDEQTFQQIELQNKSALTHFNVINEDSKSAQPEENFKVSDVSDSDDELAQKYAKSDYSNRKEEYIFDDDSDASMSDTDLVKTELSAQNDLSDDGEEDKFDDDIESEDETLSPKKSSKTKKVRFQDQSQKSKYRSVVDDQFFKLSNLEEFLKVEDLRAENKLDELDKDDDIDYFQDIPSDNDCHGSGDDPEDEDFEKSKEIMYDDFFDAPEYGDEGDKDEKAFDKELSDTNDLDDDDDDYDMEEGDEEECEEENEVDKTGKNQQIYTPEMDTIKTPFELEQEKIKQTILSYEDSLIQKPEWHLTGEVDATKRPKNSLLEQETNFDVNAKIVPIDSETLEDQVEETIKSIIKNKAFSDGQRTFKPAHDLNYKKEILLEQTKSKKSLAEVYEEQYLKKKFGEQEEEEDPRHVEITKSLDELLPNLQALFSHIPKPAVPDIKIVSNLPAITVEEVAPTSISDVTLLAPEEVKKKSGLIKGQTERSDTDRKRERRKKKTFQKMKYKKMQSETESDKPLTAKARKLDKINTLKKLKQNRNTKIAELGDEKIKSSKDFFSRLQETVNSKVQPPQPKKRKK